MLLRSSLVICTAIFWLTTQGFAQDSNPSGLPSPTSPISPMRGTEDDNERLPKNMTEMLLRHRQAKEKRDHAEMLKRGEQASEIAEELSTSFEKNNALTDAEIKKLNELEKLVVRIRKDLGGSDNKADETQQADVKPKSLKESLKYLKTATSDLFGELKKTSRFTISAAAIQTSNSIIRLARLLRIR